MLLGALATPVWFKPGIVITVLMLFAVPLTGLAAHRRGLEPAHRGFSLATSNFLKTEAS